MAAARPVQVGGGCSPSPALGHVAAPGRSAALTYSLSDGVDGTARLSTRLIWPCR